jgi:ATP-dependent helicase HrpA
LQRFGATEYADSRADIDQQIAALVGRGKLLLAPWVWIEQYPRYTKGIAYRVERLSGQYAKDQKNMGFLGAATERLEEQLLGYPGLLILCQAATQYRWMLEEFRISLFAQQLGTKMPVSIKRLDEQWLEVESWISANPR